MAEKPKEVPFQELRNLLLKNPVTRRPYVWALCRWVEWKERMTTRSVKIDFQKKLAVARSPQERLNIEREQDEYFRNRVIEGILVLPRVDQEWMLGLFNQGAEEEQQLFLETGNENNRGKSIMYRKNALALEKVLFSKIEEEKTPPDAG